MEYNVTVGKFGTFYVNPGAKGDGLDDQDSASLTPFNTIYPTTTPVMQFTGATDKNGKDIYEGDIIKCGERIGIGPLLRRTQGEVIYVGPSACYAINIPDGEDGSIGWDFGHYGDKEVIGNIYENPELLTPQTTP